MENACKMKKHVDNDTFILGPERNVAFCSVIAFNHICISHLMTFILSLYFYHSISWLFECKK